MKSFPWQSRLCLEPALLFGSVRSSITPVLTSHPRSHLIPLNPTAAALAVALELAPQPFSDAQIGIAPETIHLAAEVGSDLRGADHQQHLVVLISDEQKRA